MSSKLCVVNAGFSTFLTRTGLLSSVISFGFWNPSWNSKFHHIAYIHRVSRLRESFGVFVRHSDTRRFHHTVYVHRGSLHCGFLHVSAENWGNFATLFTFTAFVSGVSPFTCLKVGWHLQTSILITWIEFLSSGRSRAYLKWQWKTEGFTISLTLTGFLSVVTSFLFFKSIGENWRFSQIHYVHTASLHDSDTCMACVQFDIRCAYYEMNSEWRLYSHGFTPGRVFLFREIQNQADVFFTLTTRLPTTYSTYHMTSFLDFPGLPESFLQRAQRERSCNNTATRAPEGRQHTLSSWARLEREGSKWFFHPVSSETELCHICQFYG